MLPCALRCCLLQHISTFLPQSVLWFALCMVTPVEMMDVENMETVNCTLHSVSFYKDKHMPSSVSALSSNQKGQFYTIEALNVLLFLILMFLSL